MTSTTEPGLAGLQARLRAERAPRLAAQLERLGWDADRLAAYQTDRLRALLATAIERSPFHARRLGQIDPATFSVADLPRLPTMTKAEMMECFDSLVTDRRLTRQMVEDHLRGCGREPSLLFGDYVCLTTGGSSGLRGVFAQTIGEYAELAVAMMRGDAARLRAAGGGPARKVVAMVAAAAPVHGTGLYAVARSDTRVQVAQVPITLTLAEAVQRLNALQPDVLVGYPSRLAQLAAEQEACRRLRIAPRAVTALSETLGAASRSAIAAGFGVQPANIFGCTEGLVGYGKPGETELTFATDLCLAELVDADGQPVPPGTSSAKVLITNLHNFTQPLIRYELNDSMTACPGPGTPGFLRATVEGRDDGAFRYGSTVIHPLALRAVLSHFEAMTEYQVRQTERGVDVAVVARGALDPAALAAELTAELCRGGLADPEVAIRFIPAIAPHAETGKIRRFIPAENEAMPAKQG